MFESSVGYCYVLAAGLYGVVALVVESASFCYGLVSDDGAAAG